VAVWHDVFLSDDPLLRGSYRKTGEKARGFADFNSEDFAKNQALPAAGPDSTSVDRGRLASAAEE
jgi:hypothetical protein